MVDLSDGCATGDSLLVNPSSLKRRVLEPRRAKESGSAVLTSDVTGPASCEVL